MFGPTPAFWTITIWEDEEAMKGFRNTAAHKEAMPKLLDWCSEASMVRWTEESRRVPDLDTAVQKMHADGRLTGVRQPSDAQAAGEIPALSGLEGEIPLRPAGN